MTIFRYLISILAILFISTNGYSQSEVLYKQIDSTKLYLEVYKPDLIEVDKTYPAMVFFFGGGWNSGSRKQFLHQAKYFSKKGIICFLADYRTKNKHKVTPFECLKDAKSAMRFVRENASSFNVNPDAIIASGGSAGGHLAAATALIEDYNDPQDNLNISCKPNYLVLYNPVIDNGPAGYGYERIGDNYKNFSPLHNINSEAPPTLLFLGTEDHLIPVTTFEYYKLTMDKIKKPCVLKIYENGKHGFFNYNKKDMTFFKNTVYDTQVFLESYDLISEDPIFNNK